MYFAVYDKNMYSLVRHRKNKVYLDFAVENEIAVQQTLSKFAVMQLESWRKK